VFTKWLITGGLVLLAFWLWRKARVSSSVEPVDVKPRAAPQANTPVVMVPCAHCGVHLAKADAVEKAGQLFCSAEHAARR
jgi:uncharacterized protein